MSDGYDRSAGTFRGSDSWDAPPAQMYGGPGEPPSPAAWMDLPNDAGRHYGPPVVDSSQPLGRPRKAGAVVLRGIVRAPALQFEPTATGDPDQVLSLTLLTESAQREPIAVAVELRAAKLRGPVPIDGQEIEVVGRMTKIGVLQCRQMRMLDTGAIIVADRSRSLVRNLVLVILVVSAVAIIGAAVGGVLHFTGHNPFAAQITVPRVTPGETLTTVDSRLRAAGLNTQWYAEDTSAVPFGSVIRLDPAPGTELRTNATVAIYYNNRMGS